MITNKKIYDFAYAIKSVLSNDIDENFLDEEFLYRTLMNARYEKDDYAVHLEKYSEDNDQYYVIFIDKSVSSLNESKEVINKYLIEMMDTIYKKINETSIMETLISKIQIFYVSTNYEKYLMVSQFIENEVDDIYNKYLADLSVLTAVNKKNIIFKFFYVKYPYEIEELLIGIDSRVKRATISNLEKLEISGDVFTASLYDIVKMFGLIGDELFKYNLRIHLQKNINDVDSKIKNTLHSNPEEFWYLNNGITILVNKNNTHLRNSTKITLENLTDIYHDNDFSQVSVINGAQTLSVAARYFFNLNITEEDELKRKNAINKAKVIMRIVKADLNVDKKDDVHNWINKIAVSLNRQKPITTEDIVYTHFFVDAFNQINSEKFGFRIVKRGIAPSVSTKNYGLVDVIRVLYCYLGKQPGLARNSSNKLLVGDSVLMSDQEGLSNEKDSNIEKRQNSDILYGKELLLDSSKNYIDRYKEFEDTVFVKFYKPINYLMLLESKLKFLSKFKTLEKLRKKIVDLGLEIDLDNTDYRQILSIIKYGKYHLISFIYQLVLKNEKITLEQWYKDSKDASSELTENVIFEYLYLFSLTWKTYMEKKYSNEKQEEVNEYKYGIGEFKKKISDKDYEVIAEEFYQRVLKYRNTN